MSENLKRKSFIEVKIDSDFPVENLPYGIFYTNENNSPRAGTAIGDYVFDLSAAEKNGLFKNKELSGKEIFSSKSLNRFMSMGKKFHKEIRKEITDILDENNSLLRDNKKLRSECLILQSDVTMCMPVEIGDYTDFYSSKDHATNVGIMFRGKENALMPNWLHLPVAYHGRASSVILSGTDIIRPKGQTKADDAESPSFGPSRLLDFELEMGFFIGAGNNLGEPISVKDASDHIFGMVLVNDWSARDIQKWEYVPLGPFLAKNFATSISPWVVTMEALEPFRLKNEPQDPAPLPYLKSSGENSYDIKLDVLLKIPSSESAEIISRSNFKFMYWDMCQQLAHHTITGCNMRTGDLLASGTISGPEKGTYGSLLELTWRGEEPIKLSDGSEIKFLRDGDELIIRGYCEKDGLRIGFGEVSGKILPAT
ncbi:MAG TPA: fumarylacetoacetase [Ignavibacteria bacterium]|nr:fumarylacetoacetase [Bacteroidota bacterium]HRI85263.1 fumarylacetoacetase [Ignavibacteria bacterium]HRK00888.1 fumarylacetoacetase [Ignavibacteria bacterium]